MAKQVNYYEVLGVPRSASREEIRSAYRRLAKEQHPDHSGGSQENFALLQEAHATLADPNRRKQHDEALDLAYAEDQLSGLDFSSLEDELSAYREQRERESRGPGLGERLRGKFRRKEDSGGRDGDRDEGVRRRGRYVEREARWNEPHYFDPEPVTGKSGAIVFLISFAAFILAGQIGLWASGDSDPGFLAGIGVIAPFMPLVYLITGLLLAYFSFRSAGYVAVGLVFLAALVVSQQGGPELMLQFSVFGIGALLLWIYFGNRRDQMARSR